MKNIILIRHGESKHHIDKSVGDMNTSLSEKGIQNSIQTGKYLSTLIKLSDYAFYSSPYLRAKQSAEIIAKEIGYTNTINYPDDIREISFGIGEGKSEEWANSNLSPYNSSDRMNHRIFPEAETRHEFATRIYRGLTKIMDESNNSIIISHGFAISMLSACFQNIAISNLGYINYRVDCSSITELQEDDLFGNRTLKRLNYVEHLNK